MKAAAHTREQFEFIVAAPIDAAWPLFGAQRERDWAPDWHPDFVWPELAADQQGMVFKIARGEATAVWVNTCFDRTANRVQYVYFIPETLVTVITLTLTQAGSRTRVEVSYERTALTANANDLVRQMAAHDKQAGAEWSAQIDQYLRALRIGSADSLKPSPANP